MPLPYFTMSRRHCTALLLFVALILSGLPAAVHDTLAQASAPRGSHGPTSPPRPHAPQRQRGPRVTLVAVDYANHSVNYRLIGDLVQRSTDGGRRWVSILSAGGHPRLHTNRCHPARYQAVTALGSTGLFPGTLFVTSGGTPGRPSQPRYRYGCDAATGGLYVLRPDGQGHLRGADPLAAGLPYAQAAHNGTPRAYTVLDLAADSANPQVMYAYAGIAPQAAPGPGSPPAGLYRSSNGGYFWTPVMHGLPFSGAGSSRAVPRGTLTLDPAHSGILYDAIGATLYRSANQGALWTAARGISATHTLRLFINPANPLLVYALTDRGLFHSLDRGMTWTRWTDKRLPWPWYIRTLSFDPRVPNMVIIWPASGGPLRLSEAHAPAVPAFDIALTLTPQLYDHVVLALHAEPRARVQLNVVAGANPTSARLTTNWSGFGYVNVRLTGRVVAQALRLRVRIDRRDERLKPWLTPGWVPGHAPLPPATATPLPTATPTATQTPTAAPTITPTLGVPTPYPNTPLNMTWQWKPLPAVLPPCAPPVAPLTGTATLTATLPPTALMSATVTATPVLTSTPVITGAPALSPTPTSTLTPAATGTPPPSATNAPAGACDAGPPAPRQDFAAGWDNVDHRLYIFGGENTRGSVAYNDISAYSTITSAWTMPNPVAPLPSPRYGAGSAWDPVLNVFLIFGGMIGHGPFARFSNDVWAYAPATNTWTNLSAAGSAAAPLPRAHAAVTWDPANNRLLIFGGQTNDSTTPRLVNDLWAFTLNGLTGTWTDLSAINGSQNLPPPRQWGQLAWDVPAGVLRLYGGKNPGNGSMSDTWTWSPISGWQYDNVIDQPAGRQAAGYYWDETHQRFVVGPGLAMSGNVSDMWEYETPARDWAQIPIMNVPAPPVRQMAGLVWDAADRQALLFGGRVQGAGAANDLWALIPTSQAGPVPVPPVPRHVAKSVDLGQTVSSTSNRVLLTAARVQAVANAGATYARVSFYIGNGATGWPPARLQAYGTVISMLAQKGIGVIAMAGSGIVGGWPASSWTLYSQEKTGGSGDNPAIQDYVSELRVLVTAFHGTPYNVHRWEIWNEPNVPLSGCTSFNVSCLQEPSLEPSNFAALLAESYQAIKDNPATRDVQIISGGIFGNSINGAYSIGAAGADYISNTYNEGISHGAWTTVKASDNTYPLDAVGYHLYVDQGQRTTPAVIRTYLTWFHNAYLTYEGPNASKDIVITEAGWRTGDANEPQVTPQIQALNLDTTFLAARQTGYVSDLSWFELQDEPGYLHNTSWGLLDRYGNPKLAYQQFQQAQ